jgi:hypothetical protein
MADLLAGHGGGVQQYCHLSAAPEEVIFVFSLL